MAKKIPNERLRRARVQRNWSLKDVAEKIGTDANSVSRWERGTVKPGPYHRQKLCELFQMTTEELRFIPPKDQIETASVDQRPEQLSITLPSSSVSSPPLPPPSPSESHEISNGQERQRSIQSDP